LRISWPRREQLLERVSAIAAGTTLTFFLFVVLGRAITDWTWFARQYLGPVRDGDEAWGRIVSGSLLLVVIGWGVFCAGFVCLDICARLRGASPRIGLHVWMSGAIVATLALLLAFLASGVR
jgi:hypothetical protein